MRSAIALACLLALPLGADDFPLAHADRIAAWETQTLPAVASNGAEALAVWVDSRGGDSFRELYATRLADDGTAVDESGIHLAAMPVQRASVAAAGNGFVVAFSTRQGLFLARVEEGRLLAAPAFVRDGEMRDFAVNGHSFCALVQRSGSKEAVFMDAFGRVETVVPLPPGAKRLAATADAFWVVLADATSVSVAPLTADGLGPATHLGDPNGRPDNVAITAGDSEILVSWASVRNARIAVDFAILTHSGELVTIGRYTGDATRNDGILLFGPYLGWDGREFLAGFREVGFPDSGFAAVRIAPDGQTTAVPRAAFPSTTGMMATARHRDQTVVVTTAGHFTDEVDLFARMAPSFAELPPPAVIARSATWQEAPEVATIGSTALAVWREKGGAFAAAGALVAPNRRRKRIEVGEAVPGFYTYAAVAASREQFLAAWIESKDPRVDARVWARRIDTEGNLRDAAPIALRAPGRMTHYVPGIAAASDGSRFLVVWNDGPNGAYTLMAALVGADGTPVPQKQIAPPSEVPHKRLHVVWTGSLYAVLWQDELFVRDQRTARVLLVRATADGVVLDREPVVVDSDTDERWPPLTLDATSDGRGRAIVTWLTPDCVRAVTLARDGLPEHRPRAIECTRSGDGFGFRTELAAAWNGQGYSIFRTTGDWGRHTELVSLSVTRGLDPRTPPRRLLRPATGVFAPSAATTNDGVFVAYEKAADGDEYAGARRIFGRYVGANN